VFVSGVATSGGRGSFNHPGVVRSEKARIGVLPGKKRKGWGYALMSFSGARLTSFRRSETD